MDNLLSYIDIFEYCNCNCSEKEYTCYRKKDFISCRYRDLIIKQCPYLNILLDSKCSFNLIEKPTEYSLCDNKDQYIKIFKFVIVLVSKQDEYNELAKIAGVICIIFITLTNMKYNNMPKHIFHSKFDEIILHQKEHIINPLSNTYKMTTNFHKSSINDCIETINNWKEYI